jgi:hypothetical protein
MFYFKVEVIDKLATTLVMVSAWMGDQLRNTT